MEKKKYILIVVLIGILAITGISYAVWELTHTQVGTNVVNSTCFKIEFEGKNDINITKAYPITDEEGNKLLPYTFTIRNICNTNATYQINLEELETDLKKLSSDYIKVSLNEGKGKLLNSFDPVEKTISNATTAFKLTTGVLKGNDEKTFTLRLWMDHNTPAIENVMDATFKGKISIIATHKNVVPEVSIRAREYLDGITVDVSTVKNEKNEPLDYYYQLNNESEIKSEESSHTFTGLQDGKYVAKGRAETKDGIILEEKELDVTIAYEQVYISSTGNDITGNGSKESPYASLNPAYQKVKSGGETILLSDITATETANMNIENKEVTIRSEGENIYTILKDPSFTTQILDITNNNTVTTTNIIFDGNEVISSGSLIAATHSTLNLNVGTTVQNNNNHKTNESGAFGGGVIMENGNLNIDGAIITHNRLTPTIGTFANGAGIYVENSRLTFHNGTISYNESVSNVQHQNGGGIALVNSNFIMNGGEISNNASDQYGGGIFVSADTDKNSSMIMNEGKIFNNKIIGKIKAGASGGGILAYQSVIVYIKGGTIAGNTAPTGPNTYAYNGAQIIDQR